MPTTAAKNLNPAEVIYLSNLFPSPVEPYVCQEIDELQRHGVKVTACSIWRSPAVDSLAEQRVSTVVTWRPWQWLTALALCIRRHKELQIIFHRLLASGGSPWWQRARAIAHTVLGARLAALLRSKNVRHIHIHHGYLAAWVGMVAARLLRVSYSLTLHGSDLLVRPAFLEIKLQNCLICFTVSHFNRDHILRNYPQIDPDKVVVQRMGVSVPAVPYSEAQEHDPARPFTLVAVGRLHHVKDHAFLIRACASMKASGSGVLCVIAGEGPERRQLRRLIHNLGVTSQVQLLGHVPRRHLTVLYKAADLVVLTSRSEGIPLTLMEAMALGRPVLAPSITGIPELVRDGSTGFLYRPGSITDFVKQVEFIKRTYSSVNPICEAAREHVCQSFNLEKNLERFSDVFLQQVLGERESAYADCLLQ